MLDVSFAAILFLFVPLILMWALACLLWAAIRGRREPLTTFVLGLAIIAIVPLGYIAVDASGVLR